MTDYSALTKKLVADAILNKIPGLNTKVTFKLFVSAGIYDPEADTLVPAYNDVAGVTVVAAKPSFEDFNSYKLVKTKVKLIVPGVALPRDPQNDVDKVIMANGTLWDVEKWSGVPGGSLYLVFCRES